MDICHGYIMSIGYISYYIYIYIYIELFGLYISVSECVFISRRRYFVCAHGFVHIGLSVNVHADVSGYFLTFREKCQRTG